MDQAIGRAVRYCSHIDMPIDKRNVTIYYHANTLQPKSNLESIDLYLYRISANKQIKISQVEQVLKHTAIDCYLNKQTQVYPVDNVNMKLVITLSHSGKKLRLDVGDDDYSYMCGFKKCVAKCVPAMDQEPDIDTSTFDSKFVMEEIEMYKRAISDLFETPHALSFKQIHSRLKHERI